MSMFERTERGLLARWWWTVDRPMLAGIGLLVLSGLVFVFASSPPVAARLGYSHLHFVGRHALYLIPAAMLLLGSSLLSPVGVRRLAWGLLGLSLLLLVLTLLVGPEIKGARRWLPVGLVVLQPGEFVKPALVVIIAALLARAQGIGNALPAILLGAVVVALLLAQPDVSMALVVIALVGVQLFLAGLPWLLVIALAGLGAGGLWQAYLAFPHVAERIDRYIDPSSGDHYQVGLALKAIKSAAWLGTGPGEGTV
jgi:cell division protein FtsW